MRSLSEHQAAFYATQTVGYRRGWWVWALGQPNFRELYLLCAEKDESVIRMRELASEKAKGA